MCVLTSKGIVQIPYTTCYHTENLRDTNYNRVEIHVSYKKCMFLYSLSIKEGLIQCLDICEVGEAKKVFLKPLAMSELNFPREKNRYYYDKREENIQPLERS